MAKNDKKTAAESTALAPTASTAVSTPAAGMSGLLAQHAGEGLENASMRDFALPFLYVLQKLNPQVDEADDRYVQGAKPGMFINTVTGELFDKIQVIPCDFQKVFNEWVPRDAGGGFVKSWPTAEAAADGKREDTQIVETANHYVLVKGKDGNWAHAVLSLTSTKLKASRNWLSRISQRMIDTPAGRKVAPSFGCIYEINTVSEKNDKGQYYTVQVQSLEGDAGWVQEEDVFNMAVDFRSQLNQGRMKVEYKQNPDETTSGGDEDARY